MLMFADKVGGWGWPYADVRKKIRKKYPMKKKIFVRARTFFCVIVGLFIINFLNNGP